MAENPDLFAMFYTAEKRVAELDEIIDGATDQKSAGKRAVVNGLIEGSKEAVSDFAGQVIGELDKDTVPEDVRFGVFFGLVRELNKKFLDAATAYAESLVKTRPIVEVDPAELDKASTERNDTALIMKNLLNILKMVDAERVEAEELKVPRKRSSGGPRGKRQLSFYSWTVNGAATENTLTEIAKSLGYEKAVELREEMKAAGLNLTKPGATIEFTTPSGAVLIGTRDADAPEPEDDTDDDDDTDTDEEVEVEEDAVTVSV